MTNIDKANLGEADLNPSVNSNREYRAICFDLDGTLLPMDIDEFLSAYFKGIAAFVASKGLDSKMFMKAFDVGIKAMAQDHLGITNHDMFWEAFAEVYPESADRAKDVATEFYDTDFAHIGDGVIPNPAARRAIDVLVKKGYPLLLTTMPMFPRRAVEQRLKWAGIDPDVFQRITSYENSCSIKPRQSYYAENIAALNALDDANGDMVGNTNGDAVDNVNGDAFDNANGAVCGKDILMVGNNTMEDLSFCDLGADAYLVTDWMLDPIGFDLSRVKHGTMENFEKWVQGLDECSNPATQIEPGYISNEATQCALDENCSCDANLKRASDYASNITDTI